MNTLLIISSALCIISLIIIGYIYHKHRNENTTEHEELVIDADTYIHQTLRKGGKVLKNTSGFIVLGMLSLYKILLQQIRKNKLTQKIFNKLQF